MVFGGVERSKLVVVAAVAAALALGVLAQHLLVERQDLSSGLICWGIAIPLFLAGIWQATRVSTADAATTTDEPADPDAAIRPRTELILFLAVLAVGVFLRFYKLGSIPEGLNHDAAWNGLYAIRITNGLVGFEPYTTEGWYGENMFRYLIAAAQLLFGPTKFSIQVTAAAVGTATIAAFYLFVRRLFDTRLAVVAAFLLSVSGWHVTFSKVGWRMILVPLFAAVVFYFLTRAVQERRARDFILAGLALGLSLYTYDSARILPIVAAAFLAYELLKSPSLIRTHYLHLAAFAGAFLAAFGPMGWFALHNWDVFTGRGKFLWIGNQIEQAGSLEPLFINIKNALLMYNYRAGGNDFFVDEPLLDLPVSVFFMLGLVLALLRFRQRSYFLLLLLLVSGLAVGISSEPNGNRVIATMLPVSAFAAVFLFEAWRWLQRAYSAYEHVFTVALIAVLLFAGYSTYDSYLGPDRRTQEGWFPETSVVGRYIHDVAADHMVYATGENWAPDILTYMSYQGEGDPRLLWYEYTRSAEQLLSFRPASDRGTAFIIESRSAGDEVIDILRTRFPSATSDQIFFDDDAEVVIANVILVPAAGGEGADFSAYVEPSADERDAQRRQDLSDIAAVLLDYESRTGRFPTTEGTADVGCVYIAFGQPFGQLCRFVDQLDPEVTTDPLGTPREHGYWYQSDGNSFTIYASLETPLLPGQTCRAADEFMASKPNLYCVRN